MTYFRSSIGRKHIMALSGLGFSLFVLMHMAGNLLLFVGPKAYNSYSHLLVTNPLIYVAEAGLVLLFLVHLALGIRLTAENRDARGGRYFMTANGDKAVSLASRTMIYQGLILAVFTIYHLITFKYGTVYTATYDGVEMRDLFRLVTEVFHSPAYVVGYVVCLVLLGVHLSHGFASAFQSVGVHHPRYTPWLNGFGHVYAWGVAIGFIAPPVCAFFDVLRS